MANTKHWSEQVVRRNNGHLVSGPRVETGRNDKKIGVEIEFFGPSKDMVINELRRAGLSVYDYVSYNHTTMPKWKIVTDASVNGNGLELVSPPLTSAEMSVQLKTALEVLNRLDAKVDKSCGVHVHHEIDDLSVEHVKNLYHIYYKHTEYIDGLMPASRRSTGNNTYCKALDASDMEKVDRATSIDGIYYQIGTRYRALNAAAYVKYGTIEFRQHAGSTDFDKIMNWIMITQAMVGAAKTKKRVKAGKSDLNTFCKDAKLGADEQCAFVMERRREVKAADEERAARLAGRAG